MDNTLDALRNLYVALGGNIETVENLVIIPDLINAIANISTGIYQDVAAPLVVVVSESGGEYSANINFADIDEAYGNGRKIVLNMTIGDVEGNAQLQGKMGNSFVFTADDFVNKLHYVAAINADESVVVGAYTLTPAT